MKARAGGLGLLAAGVLLAAGLWISFHYTMAVWRLDSDTAIPLALWDGMREHGLRFLASWRYTPDNWILSLLPVSALGFTLSGASPLTTLVTGWLVFVVSIGLTALLALRLAGPRAAVVLAAVLPFANPQALGEAGYLAHPISHDVSMAWALAACVLAARALRRGGYVEAIAAAACVFIGAISDPWTTAAIALPLALASAGLVFVHAGTPQGRTAAVLCTALVLATAAAQTHAFGLLSFLPGAHFARGGLAGALNGAYWLSNALSQIYNIVPGADPDILAVQGVNLLALAALLGGTTWILLRGLRRMTPERQLIVAAAILSLGAVTASYLLGSWDSRMNVGRFFPNLYFFAPLLAAIAVAQARSGARLFKIFAGVYAALFVCAGAMDTPGPWTKPGKPAAVEDARALGQFLVAQGLSDGYGLYWGAHALAMPVATAGAVTIRPVSFRNDRLVPRPVESSSLWYGPADERRAPRRFLVLSSHAEDCSTVQACVEIATRQFGAPAETLRFADWRILVWPRSITPMIGR
jgi:hypothetical protein